MQHMILIGINTQVGKMMLIFRPALKNESWSKENYNWSAKPAITSNGEHYARTRAPEKRPTVIFNFIFLRKTERKR
jgi:hypothetical protein